MRGDETLLSCSLGSRFKRRKTDVPTREKEEEPSAERFKYTRLFSRNASTKNLAHVAYSCIYQPNIHLQHTLQPAEKHLLAVAFASASAWEYRIKNKRIFTAETKVFSLIPEHRNRLQNLQQYIHEKSGLDANSIMQPIVSKPSNRMNYQHKKSSPVSGGASATKAAA